MKAPQGMLATTTFHPNLLEKGRRWCHGERWEMKAGSQRGLGGQTLSEESLTWEERPPFSTSPSSTPAA